MTKIQIWNEVQELLVAHKASKKLTTQLEELLAPKQGGGSTSNPPMEIDGTMNYYCRFHERYEPQENMVMSQEKSKGYCKASISLWNKTNSQIKKLDSQAVEAMTSGDFENAQAIAIESKSLKSVLNNPSHYDYERDWATFNA